MNAETMNYQDWLQTVPHSLTGDSLRNMEAYRLALFAAVWAGSTSRSCCRISAPWACPSQLYDAVGSIVANLSEGYSRGTGRDRARFYEYALGSARASRTWCFDGRQVLGQAVADHRLRFLTQIIRLLLKMIPDQRGQALHESVTHLPHLTLTLTRTWPDC